MLSRRVGFYYIFFSIIGSLLGFSFSILLRIELNSPFTVIGEYFYYTSVTAHAVVMVFFFLTTLSSGFYNILLHGMCFLKESYSSKLSLYSFLLCLFSLFLLVFSLFIGEFVNTGWTLYFPLSSGVYNDNVCLDFAILSLLLFVISSMISSLNIICTVISSFINFESLLDIPIFVWSGFFTSFLVLFSTPSLICVLIMLLLDRNFNTYYFDCEFGGSSILFQNIFWFFGHPEVYILIIPVFGIISQCIYDICGNYIYNKNGIIFSMLSLTVLSFLVWGHHMVTAGLDLDVKGFFMISTIVISVPTGVKVFSWVYTLFIYGGEFNLLSGLLFMFIFTFTLGGITGVFLSNYSLDIVFHDSYFVVGHFHTILAVASLFGYICGLFIIVDGFKYVYEKYLSIFYFIFSFIIVSTYQLIFSFHVKGVLGVPRRVSNYMLDYYFLFYLGTISTIGVWISLLVSILLLFFFINDICLISIYDFYSKFYGILINKNDK